MTQDSELHTIPARRGRAARLSKAEMDCVVAMSCCPQDILPINGEAREPTEAHYQILG